MRYLRDWARRGSFIAIYLVTALDYFIFWNRLDRKVFSVSPDQPIKTSCELLDKDGVCIIENYWSEEECSRARNEVDRVISEYPSYIHSAAKSDQRIYGANNASEIIEKFSMDPLLASIATQYNRNKTRSAFTLCARLPYAKENQGSGEGWHRDAFFRQFKAILYLSDVDLENGPFQVIYDSHKLNMVLRDIKKGGLGYMQYRITDDQVGRITAQDPVRLNTYAGKAGTLILVDTSSIHRGMPIRAGIRYALTNYYFPESLISPEIYEKFLVLPRVS